MFDEKHGQIPMFEKLILPKGALSVPRSHVPMFFIFQYVTKKIYPMFEESPMFEAWSTQGNMGTWERGTGRGLPQGRARRAHWANHVKMARLQYEKP
jgi:hypothetical protein